jgi:hypothetical protein
MTEQEIREIEARALERAADEAERLHATRPPGILATPWPTVAEWLRAEAERLRAQP